ncbi:hypothetical protein LCGC14_2813700 [marine sediment metagenome]|uniref:Uncharacterized protein n=1 Tax=marine sediment metagenome TaxID=412755 RepID=A0A0F9BAI1_9ZZZZ
MSFTRIATFDDQKELAFGSIGVNYTLIDSVIFHPSRVFIVMNITDALLQFSTDGANDKFPLDAKTNFTLDIATNDLDNVPWLLPAKTGVYVKRIETPTEKSVYIVTVYGRTD